MASSQATLIIKLKDLATGAFGSLRKGMQSVVVTAGDVARAFQAVGGQMIELVSEASKFGEIERAFGNLAARQGQDAREMLKNMRDLTHGTISDMELMKQANQAMLLGLPIDKFDEMLKVARASSKATGESMDFMLQSIVVGLGRGSKLMLDNLGILVDTDKAYRDYAASVGKAADKLTEAEKKQAFINEALRVGVANADAAGGSMISAGDRMAQMQAYAKNLTIEIGQRLTPAFLLLSTRAFEALKSLSEFTKTDFFGEIALGINKVILYFGALTESVGAGIAGLSRAIAAVAEGNFSRAVEMAKWAGNEIVNSFKTARAQDLEDQKEYYAQRDQAELESNAKSLQNQIAGQEQKAAQKEEHDAKEFEKENARILEEHEIVMEAQTANEQELLDLQIRMAEDKFLNSKTALDRQMNLENLQILQKKKRDMKVAEEEKKTYWTLQQYKADTLSAFSNFATAVLGRENKAAFLLAQAAAMAQTFIHTKQAEIMALAQLGPIAGPPAAASIKAAGMLNMAAIAATTIKGLAEGGIVPATPGGNIYRIGEGGRSEAVIPLPDDFDPDSGGGLGGGNTYVFNGPILGDRNQAREFAIAIDRELLELRRSNESVAFDSDTI